ncbi:hypothetical protein Vretimale_10108 [Volvox reticuliferus]|uniref:Uncharacterized protein n=1 Tax=Volvox reticuliferus TaxID=1737510 RepID=A0A8J4BWA1_9CHLO|nr:hypothetical protein Vretifemale_650 [Volvox reticuliferus]GIM05655.1 hypothetical protein Vretimale_10108 [Volvox reticuliferus]
MPQRTPLPPAATAFNLAGHQRRAAAASCIISSISGFIPSYSCLQRNQRGMARQADTSKRRDASHPGSGPQYIPAAQSTIPPFRSSANPARTPSSRRLLARIAAVDEACLLGVALAQGLEQLTRADLRQSHTKQQAVTYRV